MADITIQPPDQPIPLTYTLPGGGVGSKGEVRIETGPVTITRPADYNPGQTILSFNPLAALSAVAAPLLAAVAAPLFPVVGQAVSTLWSSLGAIGSALGIPNAGPIAQALGAVFNPQASGTAPATAAPTMATPLENYPWVSGPGPQGSDLFTTPSIDTTATTSADLASLSIPTQQGLDLQSLGGGGVLATGTALVRAALPAVESIVTKFAARAGLAAAVVAAYRAFRAAGMSHKAAKRAAHARVGIRLRRRRMRATNMSALRRAIRRVHGFQKTARKVGALHVGAHGRFARPAHRRRRMYRRGDLSPFMVEDWEDMTDDFEDDGYDPGALFQDNGREAIYE